MLRQPETPGMGECCWEGKEWVYSKFILQTLNSNCIHSTSVIWKGRHTMSGRIHTNIADTFLHDSSSYTQYMPHLSPHLNPCKHACVPYLILIMICVCMYMYVSVCTPVCVCLSVCLSVCIRGVGAQLTHCLPIFLHSIYNAMDMHTHTYTNTHTNIADTFLHDSSSYTQYMPHLSPHLNPCKHACVPYLILIMICVYMCVHVCAYVWCVCVMFVCVFVYVFVFV
jgi:hypothetical protein